MENINWISAASFLRDYRYEVASRKYLTVVEELFVVAESKQRLLLLEELCTVLSFFVYDFSCMYIPHACQI